MTISTKTMHAKSTKSHATTPAAPAADETAAPAIDSKGESAGVLPARRPIDSKGESAGVLPAPRSLIEIAQNAIKVLDDLEASLNLNIVVPPNDANQMRVLRRVSDSALALATSIVEGAPASYPAFSGLPSATAYVQAMTPVMVRAQTLATHLQNSVLNQRTPASTQTLALYGVAKNVGRIADNQTMREHVASLKAEIAPTRKNAKPKLTKSEKAARYAAKSREGRIAKAKALLTANGYTVPPVAATPSLQPAPAEAAASTPPAKS